MDGFSLYSAVVLRVVNDGECMYAVELYIASVHTYCMYKTYQIQPRRLQGVQSYD